MATANDDMLQKFMDNEKNAKKWTIVTVAFFCILVFGLIYLAGELKSAQKTIAELRQVALDRADSLNEAISSQNENLKNRAGNYDSLQTLVNSLLLNLAELKKVNPTENVVTHDTAIIDKRTQTTIQKMITPAAIERISVKAEKYTIYIQFADGFKDQAFNLQQGWIKKYNCPAPQYIANGSFVTMVKYFNKADEAEAVKIAGLTEKKIGMPVKVNYQEIKSPKQQLEVWIGKYEPKTTEQILKKYEVNKNLFNRIATQKKS